MKGYYLYPYEICTYKIAAFIKKCGLELVGSVRSIHIYLPTYSLKEGEFRVSLRGRKAYENGCYIF